jgi:hypothetical protein
MIVMVVVIVVVTAMVPAVLTAAVVIGAMRRVVWHAVLGRTGYRLMGAG